MPTTAAVNLCMAVDFHNSSACHSALAIVNGDGTAGIPSEWLVDLISDYKGLTGSGEPINTLLRSGRASFFRWLWRAIKTPRIVQIAAVYLIRLSQLNGARSFGRFVDFILTGICIDGMSHVVFSLILPAKSQSFRVTQ